MSRLLLVLGIAVSFGNVPGRAAGPPALTGNQVAFFEAKVRPVLVEHCYACHSEVAKAKKKLRGGLYVDTRAGLLRGGDSGPAIVPGKPGESLLIKAIHHSDPDLKMPPPGKLPVHLIADLENWVKIGAPDPRAGTESKNQVGYDWQKAKIHWAYQPIPKPKMPEGTASPIDWIIRAKLAEKGLTPSLPADPRTLLRRLYFDLIGLPPSAEEVDDFVREVEGIAMGQAKLAIEKAVNRLLASPRYGERWGRHWLDVARYADTKDGVLMYGDDRIRPYAYTYRDYVIRAFNEDTPFNRFVHEQLAADQLEPKVEPWRLAAMGFLTLGRMFDNNLHDILDDRIDTTTRAFLGLTVSCARCHDHKYDAIPIADYYSLYGVFANCEQPLEPPLIDHSDKSTGHTEYEKQAGPHRKKLQELLDQQFTMLTETARQRIGDYLVRVATTQPDLSETAIYFLSLAPSELRPPIVNRWRKYLEHPSRADDPVFGPWPELMKLAEANYTGNAAKVISRWAARATGTGKGRLNPLVREALTKAKPATKADVARLYGNLLKRVYEESKKHMPGPEAQQLVNLVTSKESPNYFPKSQTGAYMSRQEKDTYYGMRTQFDKIAVMLKNAPPRAMVLHDMTDLVEPRVFVRGNPATPGDFVPRQFLRILSGEARQPFTHGSGRLDLANAITSPKNPLTARVLVNRVWMHHFGEPLVPSPNDFGTRSTPPSHPELLDWLASTFMDEGWSLKKLHRHIVLSATYQQASQDRPDCRKVDPENRLLWRAHRRRLDFEAMRDTLLLVSGRLDLMMGGLPVDVANDPKNARRTVYGLVDRQSLPGVFRAFDFASPDQSAERRTQTTVPQQALFALNSPFMIEQARALAARAETGSDELRIARLYQFIYARLPAAGETQGALRFIQQQQEESPLTRWQQLAQVLLMTNELLFID